MDVVYTCQYRYAGMKAGGSAGNVRTEVGCLRRLKAGEPANPGQLIAQVWSCCMPHHDVVATPKGHKPRHACHEWRSSSAFDNSESVGWCVAGAAGDGPRLQAPFLRPALVSTGVGFGRRTLGPIRSRAPFAVGNIKLHISNFGFVCTKTPRTPLDTDLRQKNHHHSRKRLLLPRYRTA